MRAALFLHLAGAGALLAALLAPGAALAQYVWLDEKGVKQYSDMPPPASVPNSRILKQPGMRARAAAAAEPGAEAASANAAPQPKTLAEQNAEFRKRRAEQAEKEKKAADEARLAAEKSKNCERTRSYLRALESGERIAQTDSNGERAFLSDDQRAKELRETRQIVQDCK